MRQLNSEDLEKIESLYLQMYEILFEYARSFLSSDTLAEEAIQETFCIACRKCESLCGCPNPNGWIFNTLKNVIANMKRNNAIRNRFLSTYTAQIDKKNAAFQDPLTMETLYEDIANTDEFKLLKEFIIDGKSHSEIATEHGISISASRKRVQRAKKFLQKKLK